MKCNKTIFLECTEMFFGFVPFEIILLSFVTFDFEHGMTAGSLELKRVDRGNSLGKQPVTYAIASDQPHKPNPERFSACKRVD